MPSPTREEAIALLRTEYGVNRSQAHMEYELQMSKEMIQPLYVEIGYMNPDRFCSHHAAAGGDRPPCQTGLPDPFSLSGSLRTVELLASMVPAEPGVGGLILLLSLYLLMSNKRLNQEVALRKQREQEILQLARLDPLTGLPNRLSLMEQLKHQVQSDNPGCLLFCDLNDFKRINDNFGHSQGMPSSASWPDGSTTPSATSAILPAWRGRVHPAAAGLRYPSGRGGHRRDPPGHAGPFVVNDQPMQVGISIGVSHYQHDWSPEQWLIQADRAMYCDKGGRVITLAEQSG